ncbi:hypothetical protein [Streptomyces alfalfae]|uniref:Uncharacterized protein n=1 Tax=Streptomyces alfalfae TaxID=1642299 RepID=A0A7T4PGQ0_9ACTN|nr:hypothetical protein [Streptomyces alfalfae]QQC89819.1 hypothetical protein I8755_16405 [Streptomyces alfalfae]
MSETKDRAAVPLPDVQELTQPQVCGRACVWCAVALDNTTAIDLGAREVDAHGSVTRWFPRCCGPCGRRHFRDAFTAHRAGCSTCSAIPWCITGKRLFGAFVRADRPGAPR